MSLSDWMSDADFAWRQRLQPVNLVIETDFSADEVREVIEAMEQLGGISRTTFYALVKEGELSLVKIGRRSFVQAEELDDFVRRKGYDPSGT